MSLLWWAGALAVAALTGVVLFDALAALRTSPDFGGVLRLVVEAVAGGVVLAYCVGRARRGGAPADHGSGDGAGKG